MSFGFPIDLIKDAADLSVGNLLTPAGLSNLVCEDKFDGAVADLFVEFHRGKDILSLGPTQSHARWQSRAVKERFDPVDLGCRQSDEVARQARCGGLSDRDGFAVKILAIPGDRFQRVPQRMAEVENRTWTLLGFIFRDDVRLNLAAPSDDLGQKGRGKFQEFCDVLFQSPKQFRVANDAIFYHLRHSSPQFADRQGSQCRQIAEDKLGLMKRADEILASCQIYPDLASQSAA